MEPTLKEHLKTLQKELKEEIDLRTKKLDAINILLIDDDQLVVTPASTESQVKSFKPFNIPLTYAECVNQDQQVMYALKHIGGEGFYTQVGDALISLDPSYNLERATRLAQVKLSGFKNTGILDYEKIGIKFKYKIPKPQ